MFCSWSCNDEKKMVLAGFFFLRENTSSYLDVTVIYFRPIAGILSMPTSSSLRRANITSFQGQRRPHLKTSPQNCHIVCRWTDSNFWGAQSRSFYTCRNHSSHVGVHSSKRWVYDTRARPGRANDIILRHVIHQGSYQSPRSNSHLFWLISVNFLFSIKNWNFLFPVELQRINIFLYVCFYSNVIK